MKPITPRTDVRSDSNSSLASFGPYRPVLRGIGFRSSLDTANLLASRGQAAECALKASVLFGKTYVYLFIPKKPTKRRK